MDTIVTISGKTLNITSCGNISDILYIHCPDISFLDAVTIFSDSEDIKTLKHYNSLEELVHTYQGFTYLFNVVVEEPDSIRVTLKDPNFYPVMP